MKTFSAKLLYGDRRLVTNDPVVVTVDDDGNGAFRVPKMVDRNSLQAGKLIIAVDGEDDRMIVVERIKTPPGTAYLLPG